MTIEKDIPGFPGYRATSDGRIISYRQDPPQALKPHLHNQIHYVGLYCRRRQKTVYTAVHLLMLRTYFPPRPSKKHVGLHLSPNKLDNSITNITWGLRTDLERDLIRRHFIVPDVHMKQAAEDVAEIVRLSFSTKSNVEIGAKLGLSPLLVAKIQRNVINVAKRRRTNVVPPATARDDTSTAPTHRPATCGAATEAIPGGRARRAGGR